MELRSHLARPLDFSHMSNRAIVVLAGLAGVAAGVLWLTGADIELLWAPVHVFLVWALVRELDPDRQATALLAGAVAGVWILLGVDTIGALAVAGFLMAARLVLNPVGLRPLATDLVGMAVLATVISFTAAGWVAGFGIAVAIYIDARLAAETRRGPLVAAVAAAIGSSAVATAADALPDRLPDVEPLVAVAVGLMVLLIVVRDPLLLISPVDSSQSQPMETGRLHAARVLSGVLVFAASLLLGQDVVGMGPLIIALALTLASDEIERIRTRSL